MSGKSLIIYKLQDFGSNFDKYQRDPTIEKVLIMDTVEYIPPKAFFGCTNLRVVDIVHGVGVIYEEAFARCNSLSEIRIPGSVKEIKDRAFSGCVNLRSVIIGKGVEMIYNEAFFDCTSLIDVQISCTVCSICKSAFKGCTNLSAFHVESGNKLFSDKNGILFDVSGRVLLLCPKGYSGSLSIPDGTLVLFPDAFDGCAHLTSVSIPASLEYWASSTAYDDDDYFDSPNPEEWIVSDPVIKKTHSGNDIYKDADYVFYIPFVFLFISSPPFGGKDMK